MCRGYESCEDVTRTHQAHNTRSYHYTIVACKFVNPGRVGLVLVVGTILLAGVVEDVEVVVISVVAMSHIGNGFQEEGFPTTARRMVYGAFVSFFNIVMTPFWKSYVARNRHN